MAADGGIALIMEVIVWHFPTANVTPDHLPEPVQQGIDLPQPVGARMECKICWAVYDPAQGEEEWQIPAGTEFWDLPAEWRCPVCDGPAEDAGVIGLLGAMAPQWGAAGWPGIRMPPRVSWWMPLNPVWPATWR